MSTPKIHCDTGINLISVETLQPNPKNPNQHSPEQLERIAKIIEAHGWRAPIKVSLRSGFVNTGHGRLEAAKLKGWSHVPVQYQEFGSDEEEYQAMIADNSVASWAELDLSRIHADIAELGPFDVELLGIESFTLSPPEPLPEEEKEGDGGGDKKPVQCPNCGEQFVLS